jgi:hypothetical protein
MAKLAPKMFVSQVKKSISTEKADLNGKTKR